jgi:hypothetical protein
MIPRLDIDLPDRGAYAYRVTYESETLYEDAGFSSVAHCLVAAVEGLGADAVGLEIAYGGFVSGTYPLQVIAMNHEQVAAHAVNTTAALHEVLGFQG